MVLLGWDGDMMKMMNIVFSWVCAEGNPWIKKKGNCVVVWLMNVWWDGDNDEDDGNSQVDMWDCQRQPANLKKRNGEGK